MILYLAAAAFKIWMLVDAMRRRVDKYWYFIIVALPLGDWAYFLIHKVPELRSTLAQQRRQRPMTLEALGYHAGTAPSAKNRLAYGVSLYDAGLLPQAKREFLAVLQSHPTDDKARYGLALTLKDEGELGEAAREFEALLERSPAYDEYAAALELVDTRKRMNEPEVALDLLEQLVKSSPRTKHQLALAEQLVDMDRLGEASTTLDVALEDFEHLPSFSRKREAKYARAAKALRRHIEAS